MCRGSGGSSGWSRVRPCPARNSRRSSGRRGSGSARGTSSSSAAATTGGGSSSARGATTIPRRARARPACTSTPFPGCTSAGSPRSCRTGTGRRSRATSRASCTRSTRFRSRPWACSPPTACSWRMWPAHARKRGASSSWSSACRSGCPAGPDRPGTRSRSSERGLSMERRFEGRVALVTGATTGIGQATAVRLAADGAVVGVNHLPGQDPAETLGRIGEADGRGFGVVADMRDPGQVTEMVHTVADRGGRLDYVVSNAAINPLMTWDETTVDDFNNLFETNVRGTWVVCTEGAKQMIREGHGGAICCVSSISAHVGAPGQTAYCGTKGAISMLAKALGRDLGAHGIRMNAVEPGWVKTPMAAALLDEPDVLKYYVDRVALHRGAEPAELAGAIAYLLSADASYVTSATLLVDGGFIVNAEL